jgi:hypothetical protein
MIFLGFNPNKIFFPIIAFLEGWIVSFRISMECITPYEFWKYSYEFISLSSNFCIFLCWGQTLDQKFFCIFNS